MSGRLQRIRGSGWLKQSQYLQEKIMIPNSLTDVAASCG